ncbi:TetR/AcrR family transcriptional regulator, partial [Acinetobacter baumannii]
MSLQVNKKLDPRQRLILSALDLLRTQGLAATSVREVAKHAQAPLGSTYHYFPDGKSQIVKEALIFSGNTALEQLDKVLNQHGVRKGITVF